MNTIERAVISEGSLSVQGKCLSPPIIREDGRGSEGCLRCSQGEPSPHSPLSFRNYRCTRRMQGISESQFTIITVTLPQVIFKGEHLQKTGSFKARGAINAVTALKKTGTKGIVREGFLSWIQESPSDHSLLWQPWTGCCLGCEEDGSAMHRSCAQRSSYLQGRGLR